MAFRVLTMAVDLCRLTTRTMNVNAGHERTSKARIIHQIQLIRGITDKINSHNIARFFIAIRETYPIQQKLHIILDGAGYHRSEQVKEWAYLMNIDLHYLPPYSPNLNPIERLWKVMNEQVRNNRYFTSAKVFREEIHRFFSEILPGLAGVLARRINDNFQTLKNATSG